MSLMKEAMNEQKDEVKVPERWSAKRKSEVAIRLMRGESIETVSREIQVAVPELEDWRRVFLETRSTSAIARSRPPDRWS